MLVHGAGEASPSRIERVPFSSILWLECTTRSRMASASVGSLRLVCQALTGSWLVIKVERVPMRSSSSSSRSLRSAAPMGEIAKSSMTPRPTAGNSRAWKWSARAES